GSNGNFISLPLALLSTTPSTLERLSGPQNLLSFARARLSPITKISFCPSTHCRCPTDAVAGLFVHSFLCSASGFNQGLASHWLVRSGAGKVFCTCSLPLIKKALLLTSTFSPGSPITLITQSSFGATGSGSRK